MLEDAPRLYHCGRCGEQVRICRRCDRGNTYCAGPCAPIRRRESLHRAGARYQQSYRGACRHAARQSAWRARRAQKVTHQGSPASNTAVIVASLSTESVTEVTDAEAIHQKQRSSPPCAAQSAQISALTLARLYPHHQHHPAGPPPRCSFCQRPLSTFARLGPLGR